LQFNWSGLFSGIFHSKNKRAKQKGPDFFKKSGPSYLVARGGIEPPTPAL
jgi:hypothetical protein